MIKYLLSFFLLLALFVGKGQKIINNIKNVEKGTFNGPTTINKVDSLFIGTIIINQKNNDSIYFVGAVTTFDTSSKLFTTVYRFVPKFYGISFNADILIRFDKPFTPWYLGEKPPPPNMIVIGRHRDLFIVDVANGSAPESSICGKDRKWVRVRGAIAGDDLAISIRSSEKLYATIESIYGAIGTK